MKSSVYALMAAVLASAPAIAASSARLSDAEFIQANRCLALMSSKTLGLADVAALKQRLTADSGGRMGYIEDKAADARDDAARQVRGARGDERAKLIAERDGVCRSLLPAATVAGQPAAGG